MSNRPPPLSPQEIEDRLGELPGWTVADGVLTRTRTFPGHLAAAAAVLEIARIQEELDHHSDLTLGYRTLTLAVTTHSAGGALTELDFELARRVRVLLGD